MTAPRTSPAGRAVAVAAGLLAVACAAVVTGSAVGTLSAPDRLTVPVADPPPTARPAAPTLADPAGDAVSAAGDGVVAAAGDPVRTRVSLGTAGSVVLVADGGRLLVDSVDPAAGWQVERVRDGGDRVEVRLAGGGDARLEARAVAGRVVVDRVRAPGV